MADRSIRYQWASSHYVYGRDDGVRVRFDILAACGMAEKVFAYRMLPINPATGAAAAFFSHICSPVDLTEYPEDEPVLGQAPEWFRLPYVDIMVRSVQEAEDFVEIVREDLARLKRTLDRMDTFMPGTTAVIGDEACGAAPSSSDSSVSDSAVSSESEGPLLSLSAFGTYARDFGNGIAWTHTGTGAGSPVTSLDSDSHNVSAVTMERGQASKNLVIQGFDFALLPDAARIVGLRIRVWIKGQDDSSNSMGGAENCPLEPARPDEPSPPVLRYLSLHQPALGALINAAAGQAIAGGDFSTITAGDEDDLWEGAGWTASLIKQGQFGVLLMMGAAMPSSPVTAVVDGAEITVYYRV